MSSTTRSEPDSFLSSEVYNRLCGSPLEHHGLIGGSRLNRKERDEVTVVASKDHCTQPQIDYSRIYALSSSAPDTVLHEIRKVAFTLNEELIAVLTSTRGWSDSIQTFLAEHGQTIALIPNGHIIKDVLQLILLANTQPAENRPEPSWKGLAMQDEEVVDHFSGFPEHASYLAVLVTTSLVERVLFELCCALSGSNGVMILRDIIQHPDVCKVLGEPMTFCLRALFLPKDGINLRNLVWHGFASPHEVHPSWASLLVILLLDVGHSILNRAPYGAFAPQRLTSSLDMIDLEPVQQEKLDAIFFDQVCAPVEKSSSLLARETIELVERSCFFLPVRQPMVLWALKQLAIGRWHWFGIVALPFLEHEVRCLFASINDSPEFLQAHTDKYYSTLDGFGQKSRHQVLLDFWIFQEDDSKDMKDASSPRGGQRSSIDEDIEVKEPTRRENALLNALPRGVLDCLLDLFMLPDSPAPRGKLAHGELLLEPLFAVTTTTEVPTVEKQGRTVWLLLALTMLALCVERVSAEKVNLENSLTKEVQQYFQSYSSYLHPSKQLARRVERFLVAREKLMTGFKSINWTALKDGTDGTILKVQISLDGQMAHFDLSTSSVQRVIESVQALARRVSQLREFYRLDKVHSQHQAEKMRCYGLIVQLTQDPSTTNDRERRLFSEMRSRISGLEAFPGLRGLRFCLEECRDLAEGLRLELEQGVRLVLGRRARSQRRKVVVKLLVSVDALLELLELFSMIIAYQILEKRSGSSKIILLLNNVLARVNNRFFPAARAPKAPVDPKGATIVHSPPGPGLAPTLNIGEPSRSSLAVEQLLAELTEALTG